MWGRQTPSYQVVPSGPDGTDDEASRSPLPESRLHPLASASRKMLAMVVVIVGLVIFTAIAQAPSAEIKSDGKACPDYGTYAQERHEPFSNGSLRLPFMRPAPACRTFVSSKVDSIIDDLAPRFQNSDLAMLFTNAFSQTLDTTVRWQDEQYAFIVTGDINAEWLRDTYNQMNVYADFLAEDDGLRRLFKRILALQARYITQYPFCNSFQAPPESGISAVHNSAADGAYVEPPYNNSTVFESVHTNSSLLQTSVQH